MIVDLQCSREPRATIDLTPRDKGLGTSPGASDPYPTTGVNNVERMKVAIEMAGTRISAASLDGSAPQRVAG